MQQSNPSRPPACHRLWLIVPLLAALLATSLTLLANTPGRLLEVPAGSCYCHCAESHARTGCVKMCELPKYASRWWAVSCAKSRLEPPADNHGARPRLPHPARAEHARL